MILVRFSPSSWFELTCPGAYCWWQERKRGLRSKGIKAPSIQKFLPFFHAVRLVDRLIKRDRLTVSMSHKKVNRIAVPVHRTINTSTGAEKCRMLASQESFVQPYLFFDWNKINLRFLENRSTAVFSTCRKTVQMVCWSYMVMKTHDLDFSTLLPILFTTHYVFDLNYAETLYEELSNFCQWDVVDVSVSKLFVLKTAMFRCRSCLCSYFSSVHTLVLFCC